MENKIVNWLLDHRNVMYGMLGVSLLLVVGSPLISKWIEQRVTYDWNPENVGWKDNKDPFGTYYVRQYLADSLGYEIVEVESEEEAYDILDKKKKYNVLCYAVIDKYGLSDYQYYDDETEAPAPKRNVVFEYARPANNFILANIYSSNYRKCGVTDYYFDSFDVKAFKGKYRPTKKRLFDPQDKTGAPLCYIWETMLNSQLNKTGEYESRNLLVDDSEHCFAMQRFEGFGKVTFVGSEFFMSNYCVTTPEMRPLFNYLITNAFDKNKPILIIYKNAKGNQNSESEGGDGIFYVLLEHPATALTLWILVGMFFMWIIMNSRRRRAPFYEVPLEKNASISYVKHLATLYDYKTDYRGLLVIEQRKLLYKLRKEYMFDMRTKEFTLPSQFAPMIAKTRNVDEPQLKVALSVLEELTAGSNDVSRTQYEACLQRINAAMEAE